MGNRTSRNSVLMGQRKGQSGILAISSEGQKREPGRVSMAKEL